MIGNEISSTRMNSNSISLRISDIFIYILLAPSLVAYHALDRAKIIYFIPAILLIIPILVWLSRKNKKDYTLKIEPNMVVSICLFVSLVILSISINVNTINTKIILRDILIVLSPLVVFLFKMKFNHKHVLVLFLALVISYFSWVGFNFEVDLSFNFLRSNYNMTSEFHNGALIGCFFIFFLYRKKFIWLIIAGVLVILSGKRSIFLGILPAITLFYFFIKPLGIQKNKHLSMLLGITYFLAFYLIGINLDSIANWFIETILNDRNYTLHRFLMGREIFITHLKEGITNSDLLQYLFGHGPGQADVYLFDNAKPDWGNYSGYSINPHNDFLKIRFDYGLIGSLLFFLIFYSAYYKSSLGQMMFYYTIPLFLVDNTYIFIYYWFTAMVIARYEENDSKSQVNLEND